MARRVGLTENRFAALVQYYLNGPQLGMALQALQRGKITEAQYRHALTKQGIEPQYHDAMVDLRRYVVPPTDLVRMAVREVFNAQQRAFLTLDAEYPGDVTAKAGELGIEPDTMRDYWAAHWELPSYTQLAAMLHRGELEPQEFRDALKALDYAPVWRRPLEVIARAIPTMTDFIRFAQREVFSPGQRRDLGLDADYPDAFTAKAALHGMTEQDARDYWAAHWRLPSARQGYTMLWRHEIEAPELDGLLKALDYPAVWRRRLANIAHIKPGRIDLKRFYRHGIYSRAQLLEGYRQIGYAPADAESMTAVAIAESAGGDEAQTWANRARSRLFAVAHNEYLAYSIDPPTALRKLEAIGISDAEGQTILALWNEEAEIQRLELTPAQIRKAYRKALYTETVALAELEERGYSPDDARTFLASG
jgi:hypothetical protein